MKIVVDPEARKELRETDRIVRKEIGKAIENLKENPLPENSYVIQLLDGTEVQCLKLQEENRNSELNHRVTYDIEENEIVRIYGVFPRKPGYTEIKKQTRKRV